MDRGDQVGRVHFDEGRLGKSRPQVELRGEYAYEENRYREPEAIAAAAVNELVCGCFVLEGNLLDAPPLGFVVVLLGAFVRVTQLFIVEVGFFAKVGKRQLKHG